MTNLRFMTKVVNVAEAKAQLSKLLDRAAAGEEIVLGKAGKPYAKLVRAPEQEPRQPGMLKHWVIPDEFWAPWTEEELALFEGSETDAYGISLPRKRKKKKK
jgi:prevent-host-death family protein